MQPVLAQTVPSRSRPPGPPRPRTTAVDYDIAFPRAQHHEAQVSVTIAICPPGRSLPDGALLARALCAARVRQERLFSLRRRWQGRPLAVQRTDPYGWTVPAHDGTVTVRYTLFGDRGDGTYAQIDPTHARLNIPATFLVGGRSGRAAGTRPLPSRAGLEDRDADGSDRRCQCLHRARPANFHGHPRRAVRLGRAQLDGG